jgi:CRP-like cAMP-binding protein
MSTTEELEHRLQDIPLFANCPRADLWVVAQRCEIRNVPAGTQVLRAGEPGDEFFVMLDGKVEVQRDGAVLSQLGPGDHFGELAVLDPAPRNADVIVSADATLGVLSHAQFRLVLDAVPGVAEAMLAFLARRVRDESRHGDRADF